MTYRSWLTLLNSALFCGLHWILKLAVSTNCPTVALNPDRNALNGYHQRNIPISQTFRYVTAIPFPDAFPLSPEAFQAPSTPRSEHKGGNSHNSPPQPHTQTATPPPRSGTLGSNPRASRAGACLLGSCSISQRARLARCCSGCWRRRRVWLE